MATQVFALCCVLILFVSMASMAWVNIVASTSGPFGWLHKIPMPEWLAKPLFKCSKCVSGQWMLWLQITLYRSLPWEFIILNTLVAIFITWQIDKLQSHF